MNSVAIAVIPVLLLCLQIYFTIGAVFAVLFVIFLIQRVDPSVRGWAIGFRLIILPGVSVFWPLFVWRLIRGQQTPTERNIHRLRAHQNAS
ncbi:hypothetical protein IQ266_11080 [filamentous cyanobacterium LEGE 11480]|uniref:Uncharacterized protein n=1 Tax=Romeriopsis navalis LEGE 11480 TaxID=2777977 RepID=A0A928Z348_9CYAN|nr:hypothetical protein [Romeriopsis navalis]MBE9030274.1 hypothetical protein [Romeriopsis navalis LEGE 11480]